MTLDRRQLLKRSGAAGIGIAFAGSVGTLFAGPALAAQSGEAVGYGPLIPDPAGFLDLPRGFTYRIISRTGQPTSVPGQTSPGSHDGQAAFSQPDGSTILVRNAEQRTPGGGDVPAGFVDPSLVYDPGTIGGTATVKVGSNLQRQREYVSLYGTNNNCAGGRTPWETWLTCEETEDKAGSRGGVVTKDHGYVFEVDPVNEANNRNPFPLKQLGRYAHEAAVVDPNNGTVYLTEDASAPFGLLYRFVPSRVYPKRYGGLRNVPGKLQAMKVPGVADLSTVQRVNATFTGIQWVDVPEPDAQVTSTRKQFRDDQVTRSQKLEGAWWNEQKGEFYFVASYSRTDDATHDIHDGQVWRYNPKTNKLTLDVIFRPGETRFDSPDNITVSPYGGGVVLAEDGDGEQHLIGVAQNGLPFPIARNAFDVADPPDQTAPETQSGFSEFAGVTFSDDGKVLFANVQTPGIMYAITGPWKHIDPSPAAKGPK